LGHAPGNLKDPASYELALTPPIRKKQRVSNPNQPKKCGFCNSAGHKVSTCPRKNALGTVVTDFSEFEKRLKYTHPIRTGTFTKFDYDSQDGLFKNRVPHHIQVHALWMCTESSEDDYSKLCDVAVEITCLTKKDQKRTGTNEITGTAVPELQRVLVPGESLLRIVDSCVKNQNKYNHPARYVFDNVMKEVNGNPHRYRKNR
jgi:hypothetical protein